MTPPIIDFNGCNWFSCFPPTCLNPFPVSRISRVYDWQTSYFSTQRSIQTLISTEKSPLSDQIRYDTTYILETLLLFKINFQWVFFLFYLHCWLYFWFLKPIYIVTGKKLWCRYIYRHKIESNINFDSNIDTCERWQ